MKTLKHIFLLIGLTFVLLWTGCSNDGADNDLPESEYYMKFKVDGKQKMYDPLFVNGVYLNNINVGYYIERGIGVVGLKDPLNDGSEKNSMAISIILHNAGSKIQTNTVYSNKNIIYDANGVPNMSFSIFYYDENGKVYASSLKGVSKVNFTEINDTSVKGVFSGQWLYGVDFDSIQVTDGNFNAKNPLGG